MAMTRARMRRAEAGMQVGQWRLGYCSDRNRWDLGHDGDGSGKAQEKAAAGAVAGMRRIRSDNLATLLPCLYRTKMGSRKVSAPIFRYT